MDHQAELVTLLKRKGTGPTMSKSLHGDDFTLLENLLASSNVNLTTKATMMTAILTLDPNPEEANWIQTLKNNPAQFLPKEIVGLCEPIDDHPLLQYVKAAIDHQHLNAIQMAEAMDWVLAPETPEWLKGSFLEAQRLKRETQEENDACLRLFYERSQHLHTKLPLLIDLSNGYDGMNRHHNLTLFTAPLLASIGFPVILHGIDEVAPKKEVTPINYWLLPIKTP